MARAISKSPKIILLDEAASTLEGENEMEIQNTLDKSLKERWQL